MTHADTAPRAVGFLGLGRYDETNYQLGNRSDRSKFSPLAIAGLLDARNVTLLTTADAQQAHGEAIRRECETRGIGLVFREIPEGRTEADLRSQFRILRDELMMERERPLALDITLGFRAQPFFSAATLATLAAAEKLPTETRLFYGAFDARTDTTTPVWELTSFLDMIRFAFAAALFRHSGDGRPLAEELEAERRRIAERAKAGERGFARSKVIRPLRVFSEDLAASRVAGLLVGTESQPASAPELLEAISTWRSECNKDHPALEPILDDLIELCGRLAVSPEQRSSDGLAAPDARLAMATLANWFFKSGRLTEAAAIAREEIVNRMADTPTALHAGHSDFDEEGRRRAERRASSASHVRGLLDWRNDLLHAGMRKTPQPGDRLARNVKTLVEQISRPPRTVIVSRHAGALDWLCRRGFQADETKAHISDVEIGQLLPGDRVVGTLPPDSAARLCDRGVLCDILVVPTDPPDRGRELSADELEAAGAYIARMRLTIEPLNEE